jgi:hypothetical protein
MSEPKYYQQPQDEEQIATEGALIKFLFPSSPRSLGKTQKPAQRFLSIIHLGGYATIAV